MPKSRFRRSAASCSPLEAASLAVSAGWALEEGGEACGCPRAGAGLSRPSLHPLCSRGRSPRGCWRLSPAQGSPRCSPRGKARPPGCAEGAGPGSAARPRP